MLQVKPVTSRDELVQIHQLNQQNLKANLQEEEQEKEGFVTWLYSLSLLEQMHHLSPAIIVSDNQTVAAYALAALKESRAFHPDLETMFRNLETLRFRGKPVSSCNFYCMGQICVAKNYRGQGLVQMLYRKHKEVYGEKYDFLLTEISTSNHRSMRAHEKIGFKKIYTYRDTADEWDVVVWEWRQVIMLDRILIVEGSQQTPSSFAQQTPGEVIDLIFVFPGFTSSFWNPYHSEIP